MEDLNQYVKNIYIIRRRLAEIRKRPGDSYFEYWVGDKFRVLMYPRDIQDLGHQDDKDLSVIHFDKVDVNIYDAKRGSDGFMHTTYIYLDRDSRFINYEPIKYKQYGAHDGREMPINILCELIKYLHTISKLTAFL